MSTFTQIYYHIVFSTKNRENVLDKARRESLFKYIWGVLKNKKCHLYRINGTKDHIHILTSLHPTICLSDIVKTIKLSSSKWIKQNNIFSRFDAWQEGYGGFTISYTEKDGVIDYIVSQEEHHKKESFKDEFKRLLQKHGVEYDEKYLS